MPLDVKEAATRKIGPLPAWGWGAAIGGAVLVSRLFRKGSATPNAGYAPTVSGGGGSFGGGGVVGTAGDATPTDVFSGANSLVEQLQGQVDTLTGSVDTQQGLISGLTSTVQTLTDYQGLQSRLIDLLKQRDTANASIAQNSQLLSKHQLALKACTTTACKTSEQSYIDKYTSQLAAANQRISPINSEIESLQSQLNEANT